MTRLVFAIPGQCVPKARPRVGHGGAHTTRATRLYEQRVAVYALAARQKMKTWPRDAEYRLTVYITNENRIRRDGDNQLKSLMDGCNGILWDDDYQVSDGRFIRCAPDKGNPHVRVEVETVTGTGGE